MSHNTVYNPQYENSWALVIGINAYPSCPLEYACNDANAFADALVKQFGFPENNVSIVLDAEATAANIRRVFLSYAESGRLKPDDRLIVFFAGHGDTKTGSRGEIGYLVPVDGNVDDLSTLIRWDELTLNAELIPAKHVLFIMDACYGGLAITRASRSGSMRFMKDMLQRYARQVLTGGKADEPVADGGGPRAGHSMFTGHLLNALDGDAASDDGILTANKVMAYVYDKVSKDHRSRQTPHFGFIEGDGDLIFNFPATNEGSEGDEKKGQDILIAVPASLAEQSEVIAEQNVVDKLKEYLSEPKYKIKLDDLVASEMRVLLEQVGYDDFPVNAPFNAEMAIERMKRYESIVEEMQKIIALLGKWGAPENQNLIETIFARLADNNTVASGLTALIGLRWYPALLLVYSAGIAALSVENYGMLLQIFTCNVSYGINRENEGPAVIPIVEGMLDVERANIFKNIPGYERNYVPRSEYLYKALQPALEDLLFLGTRYERLFDRLEVFLALVYADIRTRDEERYLWGPPGRFAWKYSSWRRNNDPFTALKAEAERQKDNWLPLRAGFFQGSYERFQQVAEGFEGLLKQLNWF